ncbi:alanine racemase [Maritimibacter sp. 55A14]|uniref:alanine racemase n=1 Tax=Maritimibacter sp. 55A14 TaxID=2174844 RepID=UPI000D6211F2|nr:alanine racemase [Maritimibacter sp. 55A14]PWE34413.1 alanine racemase [Maritimibacter sp. 55A14]
MTRPMLTIDLDALAANWRGLDAASAATVETGAVVKADAYGLGLEKVAPVLADAGARSFFVALAEEGAALRRVLGPGPAIHVFSGHMDGDAAALAGSDLIPLLNSAEQAARHFAALPGHPFGVQLDSGMNRLGMEPGEFAALRDRIAEAGPRLLLSHLACADEPDYAMNAAQLQSFAAMTQGLDAPRSLAATGGTLLGAAYHFELCRPGIGLYGGRPYGDAQAVVQVSVPVIQTRTVTAGEAVGYGATWTAPRDSNIATVAVGYADGFTRHLSNAATLWAGARACPLVGRVSMDLLTVDVTGLDRVPDSLDVLGPHQGIDALADAAGTIGYEILTSLGARYARGYIRRNEAGAA